MKIPQNAINFIVAEATKRKLPPGEFFTQVVSGGDSTLVLECFFEWARQEGRVEEGKIDLSDFLK